MITHNDPMFSRAAFSFYLKVEAVVGVKEPTLKTWSLKCSSSVKTLKMSSGPSSQLGMLLSGTFSGLFEKTV